MTTLDYTNDCDVCGADRRFVRLRARDTQASSLMALGLPPRCC